MQPSQPRRGGTLRVKRLFVVVSQARIFCGSVQDLDLEPGLELKNEIKTQMSGIITISICKKQKQQKAHSFKI